MTFIRAILIDKFIGLVKWLTGYYRLENSLQYITRSDFIGPGADAEDEPLIKFGGWFNLDGPSQNSYWTILPNDNLFKDFIDTLD